MKSKLLSWSYVAKPGAWIAPWSPFLLLLSWGWRVKDLFHAVPAYGDVLEVLWGISWYGDHLFTSNSPLFFPLIFHPLGWHVTAFGYSPAMFVVLIPLYKSGGAAFAYNVSTLLSFFVAFAGMYLLTRRLGGSGFAATLAALLFTFWGFRWVRINGHLNIALSTSLLPWLVWSLEHALRAARRQSLWFVAVGVVWGLSIAMMFYFIWIGGLIILVWSFVRCWSGLVQWRACFNGAIICGASALLLSGPTLLLFLQGNTAAGASFYNIAWVDAWGASLNSLPLPFVLHPWLGTLARRMYQGPFDESGIVGLGIGASVLAIAGLWQARASKMWRPAAILTLTGLLLAMGFTLRWNGKSVQVDWLRPLDVVIWKLGHWLKPGFFADAMPFPPFDHAIPLPGLVLAALLPFWEGARTLSRYVFIGATSFFLLVSQMIQSVRQPAVRVALAVLVIAEVMPFPSGNLPASPPAHPAFEWIRQNSQPDEGIVDLHAPRPHVLELMIQGEVLWATRYHERPTAAGASSVWPNYTVFLRDWLLQHSHAFQNSDFVPLLRYYQVSRILLHMQGANEKEILEEARRNNEIQTVQCFDPPAQYSPWPYPICVLSITPRPESNINLLLRDGWSGQEDWGIWAEGAKSHAQWVAVSRTDTHLRIEAFPQCAPGKNQTLTVKVNGKSLAIHQWQACEPWSEDLTIPASQIRVGWNELVFSYGYAARPVDLAGNENPDVRWLSVGFTRLQIMSH